MKSSDIKKIVKEEIRTQRKRLLAEAFQPEQDQQQGQQQPDDPQQQSKSGLNPNKAKGIITGAVKTLVNSGALQGVDISKVEKIVADLMTHLQNTAPSYVSAANPEPQPEDEMADEDLTDQHTFDDNQDELSDQGQYDPSLEKTTSDAQDDKEDVADEETSDEEPLFEVKDFGALLK